MDILETIDAILAGRLPNIPAVQTLDAAAKEIRLLRTAVVKYGDKSRMATVEPMDLQQAIDRSFETELHR